MAPESIKKKEYSSYSDIWAFGVTLIEIVTRKDPFAEMDAVQAAVEIWNGLRLTFPSSTPSAIAAVIVVCFQEDPFHRGSFEKIYFQLENAKLGDWDPK